VPYVHCPRCGLRSYSAARFSNRDACPDCHETFVLFADADAADEAPAELEAVTIGREEDEETA
jgi:transposase-like protein